MMRSPTTEPWNAKCRYVRIVFKHDEIREATARSEDVVGVFELVDEVIEMAMSGRRNAVDGWSASGR